MSTQIALIAIEGVLAQTTDLRSAAAQRWARPLYEGIRSQYRTVGLSAGNSTVAKNWLRKENMGAWSAVLGNDTPLRFNDWKVEQVQAFLANGWEMAFLLDCDPQVTLRAQEMGVLTLTLGTPLNWPGWKPEDLGFRPWQEMADTVESSP